MMHHKIIADNKRDYNTLSLGITEKRMKRIRVHREFEILVAYKQYSWKFGGMRVNTKEN
jgi:hypothetical protein